MSLSDTPTPSIRFSKLRDTKAIRAVQRIAFPSDGGGQTIRRAKSMPRSEPLLPFVDFTALSDVTCFTKGTLIRTPGYDVPIETLTVGDIVETRDHGPQVIRWIGKTEVKALGEHAPIEIAEGALGNAKALRVSPQHRMLLTGWRCAKIAGTREVLAPAQHLVNDRDITRVYGGKVTYIHLAFDQHQVVVANGVASESFHPDAMALDTLSEGTRRELLELFPEIAAATINYGPTVRPEVKPYEARLIRP